VGLFKEAKCSKKEWTQLKEVSKCNCLLHREGTLSQGNNFIAKVI
jgi:hypothetical protein